VEALSIHRRPQTPTTGRTPLIDQAISETAPNPNDAGVSREPTAEEVAEAIELLERFMASRNTLERQVIEMRLQGESTDAIAQQINRTERTVRRVLESLRLEMESRFADQ
jgi:DNA-directed RNA polymerase specialized sigma24 family protein